MLGLDVTAQLIGEAREAGGSDFSVISCENIAAGRLKASVDQAVCNFALLGKESVANLFLAIPSLLNGRGARVVQALYPVCLLYTSDAADERSSVDLGGRRIIKKKKKKHNRYRTC